MCMKVLPEHLNKLCQDKKKKKSWQIYRLSILFDPCIGIKGQILMRVWIL